MGGLTLSEVVWRLHCVGAPKATPLQKDICFIGNRIKLVSSSLPHAQGPDLHHPDAPVELECPNDDRGQV